MAARTHRTKALSAIAVAGVIAGTLVACAPQPPPGSIECQGGSGRMTVSPGVTFSDSPNTYELAGPSTTSSCVDGTGAGITSARFEEFSVYFPSIGCLVTVGTQGEGTGTVRWSDGTLSSIDLVATLDSAYGGEISSEVTSGHFVGMTGTTRFLAAPTQGDCFDGGITGQSIQMAEVSLRHN